MNERISSYMNVSYYAQTTYKKQTNKQMDKWALIIYGAVIKATN